MATASGKGDVSKSKAELEAKYQAALADVDLDASTFSHLVLSHQVLAE